LQWLTFLGNPVEGFTQFLVPKLFYPSLVMERVLLDCGGAEANSVVALFLLINMSLTDRPIRIKF